MKKHILSFAGKDEWNAAQHAAAATPALEEYGEQAHRLLERLKDPKIVAKAVEHLMYSNAENVKIILFTVTGPGNGLMFDLTTEAHKNVISVSNATTDSIKTITASNEHIDISTHSEHGSTQHIIHKNLDGETWTARIKTEEFSTAEINLTEQHAAEIFLDHYTQHMAQGFIGGKTFPELHSGEKTFRNIIKHFIAPISAEIFIRIRQNPNSVQDLTDSKSIALLATPFA